jgi:hypothetical protein
VYFKEESIELRRVWCLIIPSRSAGTTAEAFTDTQSADEKAEKSCSLKQKMESIAPLHF